MLKNKIQFITQKIEQNRLIYFSIFVLISILFSKTNLTAEQINQSNEFTTLEIQVIKFDRNSMHMEIVDELGHQIPDEWYDVSIVQVLTKGIYFNKVIEIVFSNSQSIDELGIVGNKLQIQFKFGKIISRKNWLQLYSDDIKSVVKINN